MQPDKKPTQPCEQTPVGPLLQGETIPGLLIGQTEQERRDTEALRQACFAAVDVLRDSARAKLITAEQAAVQVVKAYRAAEKELSDSAPGAPRS